MQISKNADFGFTEKVESNSAVRSPLGMSGNLDIQSDFTMGMTSVTPRARYYTLWAYYYEYLLKDKIITNRDLERLFILSCIAHHDGDPSHSGLNSIINKLRFSDEWDEIDSFELDFDISGQGYSYYNRQLERLRCAWTENDTISTTSLNKKLASALHPIPEKVLEREEYSKGILKNKLSHLCPCQRHNREQEILSKLLFGFFSKTDDDWDIDKEEFSRFMNGDVDLEFDEGVNEDEMVEDTRITRQRNLRRRNTLFMFLRIIDENEPEGKVNVVVPRCIYFRQHIEGLDTKGEMEFGRLERCREYWEFLHLNCYYIYAAERILSVLQRAVKQNPRIRIDNLISEFENENLLQEISDYLEEEVETIKDVLSSIQRQNESKRTRIDSPVNEADLYEDIRSANDWHTEAARCVLLILTLKQRYDLTDEQIRNYEGSESLPTDALHIETVLSDIDETEDLSAFTGDLVTKIKNRHRLRTTQRFSDKDGTSGTRAWLFTEQDGRLSPSSQNNFYPTRRDNRWGTIESLMTDLGFVTEEDDQTTLTEKGEKWLSQIE